MNDPVEVLKRYMNKRRYIRNCFQAGICPECQSDLTLYTPKEEGNAGIVDYDAHPGLNLITTSVVCPQGHLLTDLEYGDRSHISCECWENTISIKIRLAHRRVIKGY